MLVRDESFAPTDFGTFRSQPNDFHPGQIDFTILAIDTDDFESLVDRFVALARQETE